jgi:hypothetical protein
MVREIIKSKILKYSKVNVDVSIPYRFVKAKRCFLILRLSTISIAKHRLNKLKKKRNNNNCRSPVVDFSTSSLSENQLLLSKTTSAAKRYLLLKERSVIVFKLLRKKSYLTFISHRGSSQLFIINYKTNHLISYHCIFNAEQYFEILQRTKKWKTDTSQPYG